MEVERRVFALRHLYVYPKADIAYTYIPKNACTSFKRTLGAAQGWLDPSSGSAHDMRTSWWLRTLGRYPSMDEHIVVLRDPWDRLLSAYQNRFLMREDAASEQAMRSGLQAMLPAGAERFDVTFEDFLRYLSKTPDRDLNEHWRPQSNFLIGSYTRIMRFDRLPDDAAFLAGHGLTLAAAQGHRTSSLRRDLGSGWGRRPARDLRRRRRRTKELPSVTSMYDDELRALVADRFAEDVQRWSDLAREAPSGST